MKDKTEPHDLLVAFLLVQGLIDRRSETFFQPFGLTAAQFNILNLLARHDGRMDQFTLVELLLVGKSSVSIVLNRMVRNGLVKREEHPKDRRKTIIVLTPGGHALWKKIAPRYESGVSDIFGAIPRDHRTPFLNQLETLHHALLQSDPGTSVPTPSLKKMLAKLTYS